MRSEVLQLSTPMVNLLARHGITTATQIQNEIIPAILARRDVLAQSETGSGKTLSFAIPIIEQLHHRDELRALVLVPTRELCVQVSGEFVKFSHGKHLGVTSVYGGVSIGDQVKKLKTTNIIIATPGRLIDLLDRKAVTLETIHYLVFDEADRMLDMGFIRDIERILRWMPQKRQTLLFSATVSREIAQLSQKYLHHPKHVQLASAVKPEFLRQTYYQTTPEQKLQLLIHLLKHERDLALVFCNRKHVTAKLARKLSGQGVHAKCLHGDMSQSQRERVTADFRQKKFNVLVATDVAARGLHIEDISHVYNYEIPKDVDSYTHRVGRTARAGKKGEAISLVVGVEKKFFQQILFTYRGNITLKTLGDVKLPSLVQQSSSASKEHKGRNKPWRKKWKELTDR
ncbi:MAG: DEAD/DEAH box helicase [Ignavibacteriae bacterium]|nr:DEAD/DEAH box helicase [Ignavibacteriota bacterium]